MGKSFDLIVRNATVVTPWLALGAISGADSISRSSCVCASMKPGDRIFPAASISVSAR